MTMDDMGRLTAIVFFTILGMGYLLVLASVVQKMNQIIDLQDEHAGLLARIETRLGGVEKTLTTVDDNSKKFAKQIEQAMHVFAAGGYLAGDGVYRVIVYLRKKDKYRAVRVLDYPTLREAETFVDLLECFGYGDAVWVKADIEPKKTDGIAVCFRAFLNSNTHELPQDESQTSEQPEPPMVGGISYSPPQTWS